MVGPHTLAPMAHANAAPTTRANAATATISRYVSVTAADVRAARSALASFNHCSIRSVSASMVALVLA